MTHGLSKEYREAFQKTAFASANVTDKHVILHIDNQKTLKGNKQQFKIPMPEKTNVSKGIIPLVFTVFYSQRKECMRLKIYEKTERSRRWREMEQNRCCLVKSRWFSVGKNTNRFPVVFDLVELK